MSSPVGNPPGWYTDPWQPGMQRWWDGTQWTVHQTWTVPPAGADAAVGGRQPVAGPTGPQGRALAEPWRRLVGYVLDGFVMIPLYLPLLIWIVPKVVSSSAWQDLVDASTSQNFSAQVEAQRRFQESFAADITSYLTVVTLYAVIVATLYFTVGIGRWGRTVGGKVMGIRAVTGDGAVPGYRRALIRYAPFAGASLLALVPVVGGLVGNAVLLLLFLSMVWQPQRRGWQDLLAGTWVVRS